MNEKVRSVIIDDEPGNIITLEELLKAYCPGIAIVGTAPNPNAAAQLINEMQPELVFLDIEMPYGNAFDLLDKLAPVTFEVIFVTAFNDYAIKAFKYAALDYVLKPVNINELKTSVNRAIQRLEEKKVNTRINSLLTNLKTENQQLQKIGLSTSDGYRFENISNIMYLEADGSYTNVFIRGDKKEVVSKNLKEFEDILPESDFCRVHHSFIVNMNSIKKYFKGRGGYVEMENGVNIEIAVRKKEEFFSRFVH
jgi:two-component system LytT family response regulator